MTEYTLIAEIIICVVSCVSAPDAAELPEESIRVSSFETAMSTVLQPLITKCAVIVAKMLPVASSRIPNAIPSTNA